MPQRDSGKVTNVGGNWNYFIDSGFAAMHTASCCKKQSALSSQQSASTLEASSPSLLYFFYITVARDLFRSQRLFPAAEGGCAPNREGESQKTLKNGTREV